MFRLHFDWWLVLPIFFLSITGLLTLRGISPEFVPAQIGFMFAAILAFLGVTLVGHRLIFSFHWTIYVLCIIFLITPFFLGVRSRGAHRWIQVSETFSIQPSELVKPLLLATFVQLAVSARRLRPLQLISVGLLPIAIVFRQPDLGTALVILVGWFTVFLSKVPIKVVLFSFLLLLVLIIPIYQFLLLDYQKDRLRTFINPYSDPLGKGYHVIQSLIAVGSGGLFGRGLGHGPPSNLRFLPERHTDFIFASIGESFGFVGSSVIVLLFLVLVRRIYQVSQISSDPAASLYCLATVALLGFQICVNIGMNLGLTPVTGITLPFLSYGGSSLLSVSVMLGLINSISTSRHPALS